MELSERKREILRLVVEEHVSTGQPVGSKGLVADGRLQVSSSTVRYELAELETLGLLTHPHTSAGRVPTESGYRLYADELLEQLEPRPAQFPLDLIAMRSEVDAALQSTTEMLAQVTRLLALVSAPPLEAATVRHVEVLLLQPDVVLVVVIASTGSVTDLRFAFPEPVDPGLVTWASEYLAERVRGARIGSRTVKLAPMALLNLVSSTVNQYTALVAMIPIAYSLSVGAAAGIQMDPLHRVEIFLSFATTLYGVACLLKFRFTRGNALVMLALFLLQFFYEGPIDLPPVGPGNRLDLPPIANHLVVASAYVVLAVAEVVRHGRELHVGEALRHTFRRMRRV